MILYSSVSSFAVIVVIVVHFSEVIIELYAY